MMFEIPAWTALAIPLFSMPTFSAVTLEDMNYASVVFVGFVAISAVWYWVWGHKNYSGPPTERFEMAAECLDDANGMDKATGLP